MAPLEEPLARADQLRLRGLVLDHKRSERRRRFPALLHLATPTRAVVGQVSEPPAAGPDPGLDLALRADLLGTLLRRAGAPALAWLTRPGTLEVQDVDLHWLRAVRGVSGETGIAVTFVVVTREGWQDPASGVGRRWRRLRTR